MGSSGERDGSAEEPSDRAIALVLDNARWWAPPGAVLTPHTRIADLTKLRSGHWAVLLVGAGLDEFVSFEVEREPETLEDVARAYDLWAAACAAAAAAESPREAPPPALPLDFLEQLRALERDRAHPRIGGAEYGVWDRASPSMAVWWSNPAGDVAMVFCAVGGHHAAGELARKIRGAMSEPPASTLTDRARWAIARAQETALAVLGPAFVAYGSMVSVATRGAHAAIAHVGDARALRVRGHRGEWLTQDHVFGGEGPFASMLVRAVGVRDRFEIEVREITREVGDVLLLCSSDVWRAYASDELARLVAEYGREAPQAIVGASSARAPDRTCAVAMVS